jgi:hypothetical protein
MKMMKGWLLGGVTGLDALSEAPRETRLMLSKHFFPAVGPC